MPPMNRTSVSAVKAGDTFGSPGCQTGSQWRASFRRVASPFSNTPTRRSSPTAALAVGLGAALFSSPAARACPTPLPGPRPTHRSRAHGQRRRHGCRPVHPELTRDPRPSASSLSGVDQVTQVLEATQADVFAPGIPLAQRKKGA